MNLEYEITLRVVKSEYDDSPDEWDWQSLIDSPHPVAVIQCDQVGFLVEGDCQP